MRLPSLKRHRPTTEVAINVDEPNTLDRIGLMNATLIRVVGNSRLVEVRKADYTAGEMEVVVEAPKQSRPSVGRGVSVSYRPIRTA